MYKSLTAHTSKQGVAIGFDVLGKAMSAMEPLELGRFFAGDPDVVLDRRAQISSSPVSNTESAGVEADEMIALATTARLELVLRVERFFGGSCLPNIPSSFRLQPEMPKHA